MKRRTALLVGLCGLVGFASPAVAQQKETRIGIVTLQMKAPYFVAMVRALEAEGGQRRRWRAAWWPLGRYSGPFHFSEGRS